MKNIITISLTMLLILSQASAETTTAETVKDRKAEVMLFGTFHFANPGLDVIKTQQVDVTTPENQKYLVELSHRIADEYAPTEVLVECPANQQQKLNENYKAYLANNYTIPVNETYQLGFRTAKFSNLKKVTCFDERNVQWQAEAMMVEMPVTSPNIKSEFDNMIKDLTEKISEMHKGVTLQKLLIAFNQNEFAQLNKSLYLLTNSVGAGDSYSGADAAASWWHRNFRMYANIQKVAAKNSRIFVIGGQGHIAILNDFLAIDTKREAVDILSFL
jgi:RNase H-fold protein (predicted Holliday junction resolvase)